MGHIGMEDNVPIEHRWISRAIENAQKKVESHNFDMRKHLLEYDDVMNKQREVVYHRRRELLGDTPLKDDILEMSEEVIEGIVEAHCDPEVDPAQWDWKAIEDAFYKQFKYRFEFNRNGSAPDDPAAFTEIALERVRKLYDDREVEFTLPVMRQIEKIVSLQTLDSLWKDHLLAMDHLKEGIGLRGYAQVNPLTEYQKEGFTMFGALMSTMQQDVVEKVFAVPVTRQQDVQQMEAQQRPAQVVMSHGGQTEGAAAAPVKREGEKVGRNDPCPCGSGKKYKKCHGAEVNA